jgi:hypothetical protein
MHESSYSSLQWQHRFNGNNMLERSYSPLQWQQHARAELLSASVAATCSSGAHIRFNGSNILERSYSPLQWSIVQCMLRLPQAVQLRRTRLPTSRRPRPGWTLRLLSLIGSLDPCNCLLTLVHWTLAPRAIGLVGVRRAITFRRAVSVSIRRAMKIRRAMTIYGAMTIYRAMTIRAMTIHTAMTRRTTIRLLPLILTVLLVALMQSALEVIHASLQQHARAELTPLQWQQHNRAELTPLQLLSASDVVNLNDSDCQQPFRSVE